MNLHNFKPGDNVTVFNCTLSGTFFVEGKFKITKLMPGEDMYTVRCWKGTHTQTVVRYVDPNGQDNPCEYLCTLNATEKERTL